MTRDSASHPHPERWPRLTLPSGGHSPRLLWRVAGGQPPALVRALSSRLPRAFLLRPPPALHRGSCPPCWSPPYTTYKRGRWPSGGRGQTLPWPPGAPFSAASAEFSKASDTGPPVPSSAHLRGAPLLYRRGLPQVTSVFHVATSRGHPSVPIFLSFQSHSLPLKTVFSLDLGGAPGSTWPASCTLTDFSAFGLEPLFFSLRPSSRGGLVQPRGVYARDSRALCSPGALCPAAWLTLGWLSSPQLRHDRCNTRLLATPWPHTHKPNTLHGEGRPRRPGCQCPGSGRRPRSSLGPEVPLSASPAMGTARSE